MPTLKSLDHPWKPPAASWMKVIPASKRAFLWIKISLNWESTQNRMKRVMRTYKHTGVRTCSRVPMQRFIWPGHRSGFFFTLCVCLMGRLVTCSVVVGCSLLVRNSPREVALTSFPSPGLSDDPTGIFFQCHKQNYQHIVSLPLCFTLTFIQSLHHIWANHMCLCDIFKRWRLYHLLCCWSCCDNSDIRGMSGFTSRVLKRPVILVKEPAGLIHGLPH